MCIADYERLPAASTKNWKPIRRHWSMLGEEKTAPEKNSLLFLEIQDRANKKHRDQQKEQG